MAKSFKKQLLREFLRWTRRIIELIWSVIFWLIYRGKGEKMPPIDNLLLLDSASALAFKIRTKKVSSVQVVSTFIERIKSVNPLTNCVIDDRFEDALKDAKAVDELILSGKKSEEEIAKETPFLGVPFTTKDCIKVSGLSLTAGLYKRRNVKSDRDAEVIALMRKAGAIPLAITNVSELCMWWESCNPVYGRSNNPYNTTHIVGGSSGGEACLQSCAGAPFGIGSDIGGSIRMPAFFNGIFGHKPSTGIVSNEGQYPIPSDVQNTFLGTGPMCRYAGDMLPMLKVLSGKNISKLQLDEKVVISSLNFFYMEDDGGSTLLSPVHPEIKEGLRKVVAYLEKAYKIKAKKVNLKNMIHSAAIWLARMKVKDEPTFSEQLANLEGSINPYLELVKWMLFMSNHTLVALLTAITHEWGIQYGSPKHTYLTEMCQELKNEFQLMLGDNGVFLYPTHPTPAPHHVEPLVKALNFAYTAIFNVMGFPATNCPLGLSSSGLPIGIQAVAGLNKDHLTLAVAVELERVFGGWVPPAIVV